MAFPYRSYDLALRALRVVSPLVSRGDSKLGRGLRGRRGAAQTLAEWAVRERNPERPLVWFHAPSVGEGLQARAVMEALTTRRPGMQVAYTHFSPSAEGLAQRMPADVAAYLPWDTRAEVERVVAALRPRLLVFTKTEVWPGLARSAREVGAGVVLVAATLPRGAGRLRWPARPLLRPVFGALDRVLAISRDDAARFEELGVAADRTHVTGDPAIDSARSRVMEVDRDATYLVPFRRPPRPTLVAGSTWEPDEEVLVPAVSRLRARMPELRLLVAPHEPDHGHLERLERQLEDSGWRTARLAQVEEREEAGDADAVLVDRVGVLAHLYTAGDVAYVGGGFHRHGLHSVVEPAAAGLPVVFGPGHDNARAAGDLLEAGGGAEVADADELADALARWFTPLERGREAGERARGYIEEHTGAADRTARDLLSLLPDEGPRA